MTQYSRIDRVLALRAPRGALPRPGSPQGCQCGGGVGGPFRGHMGVIYVHFSLCKERNAYFLRVFELALPKEYLNSGLLAQNSSPRPESAFLRVPPLAGAGGLEAALSGPGNRPVKACGTSTARRSWPTWGQDRPPRAIPRLLAPTQVEGMQNRENR